MIHCFIEGNVFVTAGVEKKKSIFLWKKTVSFISSNVSGEQGEAHKDT